MAGAVATLWAQVVAMRVDLRDLDERIAKQTETLRHLDERLTALEARRAAWQAEVDTLERWWRLSE